MLDQDGLKEIGSFTVIAPEHVQTQSEIDACLECNLQDCVFVDPAIDEHWCKLASETRQVIVYGTDGRLHAPKVAKIQEAKGLIADAKTPLSISQMANTLNIHTTTLRDWINEGHFTTEKDTASDGVRKTVIKQYERLIDIKTHKFRAEYSGGKWKVFHRRKNGERMLGFESANPYLAIAAIAMEMAKSYAD